jgi:4'-phosphopantetheinyl transferase EntD
MSAQKHLQLRLTELLPATAASCLSVGVPADAVLLPEELDHTARMVAKRLADFRHGRHCARRALATLGLDATPITVGKNREPVWPNGVTGSISHTETIAAAVAAHTADLIALGIDIESSMPLEQDITNMIRRPDESDWKDPLDAKILFSVKEAIYKCIYPQLNLFIDFQDMKVLKSETPGSYTAIPQNTNIDTALLARLRGRYSSDDGLIISSAWIEPSGEDIHE